MTIRSLGAEDPRVLVAQVAGPAALLVAKLHKIAERRSTPDRLADKDAHDIYRLLVATDLEPLRVSLARLVADPLAGEVTRMAVGYLDEMFGSGPRAVGSLMAGRAERLIGEPDVTAASVAVLAADLSGALGISGDN